MWKSGRQSAKMLDRMKCNDMEYVHIKRRDQDREDWYHWMPGVDVPNRQSTQGEDDRPLSIVGGLCLSVGGYISY